MVTSSHDIAGFAVGFARKALVTVRGVALWTCGKTLGCCVDVYDLRVEYIVCIAFYTCEVG